MAVNGWLVFFGLLWAYIVFLFWLVRSGRMQKWNLSLMLGLVLMIRTQRGKKLIDQIARPKRLWNAFGDFGTVMTLVGMVLMTLLMILTLFVVLDRQSGVPPLAASEILVIPGVNPFVPLWYGIIALIVTLVVHEGGHGVLARANHMKVKSLGLLFAIVPIGAFVEPDEDELKEAPRRERLRVFAAGATINIVLAGLLMFVFAAMVAGAEPVEGVPILGVVSGSSADLAGLRTGDVMTSVGGVPTPRGEVFSQVMENRTVNETIVIELRNGESVVAVLGNRWHDQLDAQSHAIIQSIPADRANATLSADQAFFVDYCQRVVGPFVDGWDCADRLLAAPFLGVEQFGLDLREVLGHPFGNGGANFLLYVSLPLGDVRGSPYLSLYLPAFFEGSFDGYWIVATLVFWIFWVNLMVGLTNILPMLPLDGGHIFRDAVGGFMARLRPAMEPAARERVVGRMAGAMSFLILGAFLLSVIGPRFLQP